MQSEDRISELGDRKMEIIVPEGQKEKKGK